jgi:hypothetical protein
VNIRNFSLHWIKSNMSCQHTGSYDPYSIESSVRPSRSAQNSPDEADISRDLSSVSLKLREAEY